MNGLLNKIDKRDVGFLGILALYAIVIVFRFFDRGLIYHAARFSVMQNYNFSLLVIFGYFVMLFLLYFVCLNKVDVKNKKNTYYLIMFSTVFMLPMFLNVNYFGTMDVYAWILLMTQLVCLVLCKMEWMTIPLAFLMTYISPITFFYCETIVLFLLLNKYLKQKNKKYLVFFCINSFIGIVSFCVSKMQNTLPTDVQMNLSLKQFALMIICLSPYLYWGFLFLKKMSAKLFMVVGALPSIVINIYLHDYARAIFYVFTYFIIIVMCLVVLKDEETIIQLESTKTEIKKWIPLPILVIVYPLLFMTFWIAGPLALMAENF